MKGFAFRKDNLPFALLEGAGLFNVEYSFPIGRRVPVTYHPDDQFIQYDENTDKDLTLKAAFEEFVKASHKLSEMWKDHPDGCNVLVEKYPFNKSFDELTSDIDEWAEANRKETV